MDTPIDVLRATKHADNRGAKRPYHSQIHHGVTIEEREDQPHHHLDRDISQRRDTN